MSVGGPGDSVGRDGARSAPLLDIVFLEELRDSCGAALLVALSDSAAQEASTHFAALDGHVVTQDPAGCEAAVHALKGTGAGIGLASFQMQAEVSLIAITQGRLPTADEAAALKRCWADGFAAYAAYVDAAQAG